MSDDTAHIDFESRATVDIKCGVHKYAEHHATRTLCLGYKIAKEDVGIYRPLKGDRFPKRLREWVGDGGRTVAHNMAFDRTIWNVVLRRELPDVPELKIQQTDCTMMRALALQLPGGLAELCKALKLPVQKDLEGHKAMMKLCKPQKANGSLVWNDDPALFETLYRYCMRDIEAESPVDDILPRFSEFEQRLWWLSELINDRGIRVDLPNVIRAALVVEDEGKSLSLSVKQLTKGAASATQRGKLLEWLQSHGLAIEDMKKHTLRDALKTLPTGRVDDSDTGPEATLKRLRRVLEIQQEANKTSTAKLKKMALRVCDDDHVKGEYRFNGAGTGRFSSTGVQMHNFARPDKHFKLKDAENVFCILRLPTPNARICIRHEYGSVMHAMSHSLRPLLIADEGHDFVCADYSNIEGRYAAWSAGEAWKLEAFRRYDEGTGPDLYKLAFAQSFGVSPDTVDDDQRQVGKVIELSAQYQSGHGGFLAMAKGYNVEARDVADVVHAKTAADEWLFYAKMYEQKGAQHFDLDQYEWTGVKILIQKWREAHPGIKAMWKALEEAALEAVRSPGKIVCVGEDTACPIYFGVWDEALWLRLPSGRKLCYKYPSLTKIDTPWGEQKQSIRVFGTEKGAFLPYHLYGGLIFENFVQAGCRDILGNAMLNAEERGYPIVMHTHDEAAAQIPKGWGSLEEYEAIMRMLPPEVEGLPVSVAGWRGERYRKS